MYSKNPPTEYLYYTMAVNCKTRSMSLFILDTFALRMLINFVSNLHSIFKLSVRIISYV